LRDRRNGYYSREETNDTPFGKGFTSGSKIFHGGQIHVGAKFHVSQTLKEERGKKMARRFMALPSKGYQHKMKLSLFSMHRFQSAKIRGLLFVVMGLHTIFECL
jgi:hypothetical protein